ncbi:DUF6232 family protein [Dactylosporangium sp. CS-047395]|uniref:DUF6232 family protein n=1 Tax=Dactylosporangium sp. CS-047395 TaxID=3239936 RepID=UPI003D8B0EC1
MPNVFYQDRDIVITDDVFAVWKPEPQVYDLEALQDLRIEHSRRAIPTVPLVAGALVTVGAVAGISITDRPGQFMIAAAVLSVSPFSGRVVRIFTPVVWFLRATYAGAGVTLFASSNAIALLRVRRGLMRAFAASAASVERLDRGGYAEEYRQLNALL